MAMTHAHLLLGGAGLVALAATAFDRPVLLRVGGIVGGALGFAAAYVARVGGWMEAVAAGIVAVNLARLAFLLLARRRARFSEEEQRMIASGLTALDPAQARHLLDQGLWIDGKPGEVLTREDRPVTHLFYLASGACGVTREGQRLATVVAPTFVGEITVLGEEGATATVTLEQPSRFWCVPADELRLFLRENPALRRALENSFVGTLAAKLRLANQVIAGRSASTAG